MQKSHLTMKYPYYYCNRSFTSWAQVKIHYLKCTDFTWQQTSGLLKQPVEAKTNISVKSYLSHNFYSLLEVGVQTVLWNLLCLSLHCLKSSFYYTSLNPQILQMDCIVRTSRFTTFFPSLWKNWTKEKNNIATKIRIKKWKEKKTNKTGNSRRRKVSMMLNIKFKSPCYQKSLLH